MPCLEEADLTELADQHITAQRGVVKNLRSRMAELEAEARTALAEGRTLEDPKFKKTYEALTHLKLELDGEIDPNPGFLRFEKNPDKKTAEERIEVMAGLYKNRKQYVFHDTTKNVSDPRKASMFGYPTVEEMIALGYDDIAQEMMVRATSLLQQRSGARNPVDFVETSGLEVKQALSNVIEHHHIYNNVHVGPDGRVEFKSFKIHQDKSGNLTMRVVPSYWNAEQHGRNTQFIGLLDGMHAGDDPVAHLHYYKFNDDEAGPIKDKIAKDLPDIVADAARRKARLEADVRDLEARVRDPQQYEQDLLAQIKDANAIVEQRKAAAKGVTSKPKKDLSGPDLERREAFDAAKKEAREISKRLEAHRTITNLRGEIEATENQVADMEKQHSAINLNKYPKGPERDEARALKDGLKRQSQELKLELKKQKALLKSEGDISATIENKKRALAEAEAISALTPETAARLFDEANGYFSFDKGFVEKGEHDTYRPIMNEELHRFYVRQTIEHLQKQHGDNWVEELERLNEARYRANLMERIGALADKLPA